jgi:hypothetical protein
MAWNTPQDEQVREHVDDIDGLELPIHPDDQAFPCELVNDVEHAEFAAIMGAVLDKVVTPDMVGILRPQPDARSVIEPEPSSLRLLLRYFQPLLPPDPLHPFAVHPPAGLPQKSGDAPVAITAILESKRDDVGGEGRFVIRSGEDLALGGSVLAESPADPALGQAQFGSHMIHAGATAGGA